MFKFAATLLLVWPFIILLTVVVTTDGLFTAADGRLDLARVLQAVFFQTGVSLVLLRVVWWSSNRAYDYLYWPTAIAASGVILRGIVVALNTAWHAGGLIVLIGFLMAYTLWRTKEPRQASS